MITSARIREDLAPEQGRCLITALRAPQIEQFADGGPLQLSLFDQRDLAEIAHPAFPGERLMACRNPLLAATEKQLHKIVAATQRKRGPLQGKKEIGLAVGKLLGQCKMDKHFALTITEKSLRWERKHASIEKEALLDGISVIRTNVPAESLPAEQVVARDKSQSSFERAFRSIKSVDRKVRPIFHRQDGRVKAHLFLCMLAYSVEWHMRRALAPMLFDDDQPEEAIRCLRRRSRPPFRWRVAQSRHQTHRRWPARSPFPHTAPGSRHPYQKSGPLGLASLPLARHSNPSAKPRVPASRTRSLNICFQCRIPHSPINSLKVCHLAGFALGNFGLEK